MKLTISMSKCRTVTSGMFWNPKGHPSYKDCTLFFQLAVEEVLSHGSYNALPKTIFYLLLLLLKHVLFLNKV